MSFAGINWRFWQKTSKPEADPEYEARALASWLERGPGHAGYVGPAFCEVVRRLERLEAENILLWKVAAPITAFDSTKT